MIANSVNDFVLDIVNNDKYSRFASEFILHLAVDMGNVVLVDKIIKSGCYINIPNEHGYSALHLAVFNGDIDMVELLLLSKANVNEVCFVTREVPLHFACIHGDVQLISLLLLHGANPNIESRTKKVSSLQQLLISGHDNVFLELFYSLKLVIADIDQQVLLKCLNVAVEKKYMEVENFINSTLGITH